MPKTPKRPRDFSQAAKLLSISQAEKSRTVIRRQENKGKTPLLPPLAAREASRAARPGPEHDARAPYGGCQTSCPKAMEQISQIVDARDFSSF